VYDQGIKMWIAVQQGVRAKNGDIYYFFKLIYFCILKIF
jgi:hypothetical protein